MLLHLKTTQTKGILRFLLDYVLREAFNHLDHACLTLNLPKCEFVKATETYLGKEVGQWEVRTLSDQVRAIVEYLIPGTKRDLWGFLGMAGYYRSFCKNFSVVLPLTNLLQNHSQV